MPEILEATFQIVTPMFLGGADQTPDDCIIRPPSVKGALRFWWRALHWGPCLREAQNEAAALKLLHGQEARLFGIAADGEDTGQGCCLLRVTGDVRTLAKLQLPTASAGHQYLLGLGLYHFRDKYLREALAPDTRVGIQVRFRPGTTHEERRSVARALLAMGLLGGLGSRARKGFGALAIQTLAGTDLTVPKDVDEMRETLADLTADRLDALPPYTAFSRRSRIDLVPAVHRDVWRLLGDIGGDMQRYRSFGQNGKVAGQPAERNFTDDHDLALNASAGIAVDRHPRRAVFGLPHNYFFSSTKDKADINAVTPKSDGGWSDIGANRRASPLFVHPHIFPDRSVVGVLTLLPAQFLPDDWRIGIKGKGPVRRVPVDPDWSVLHRWMDRFADRQNVLESRP